MSIPSAYRAQPRDGKARCTTGWQRLGGSGGTTPQCALTTFGNWLAPLGQNDVQRMLVDVIGPPIPGGGLEVILDRPPVAASFGFVQIGFPPTSPISINAFPGIEVWWNGTAFATTATFIGSTNIVQSIGPLPASPFAFSLQFIGVQAIVNPNVAHCGNSGWGFEASPALIVSY